MRQVALAEVKDASAFVTIARTSTGEQAPNQAPAGLSQPQDRLCFTASGARKIYQCGLGPPKTRYSG